MRNTTLIQEQYNPHSDIIYVRIIIEALRWVLTKNYMELETKCDEALAQIETMKYEYTLRQEGYQDILKYGAAFYRKECMVKTSNV